MRLHKYGTSGGKRPSKALMARYKALRLGASLTHEGRKARRILPRAGWIAVPSTCRSLRRAKKPIAGGLLSEARRAMCVHPGSAKWSDVIKCFGISLILLCCWPPAWSPGHVLGVQIHQSWQH
eukprot:10264387-Alexandrium_andersonii.AAC.1